MKWFPTILQIILEEYKFKQQKQRTQKKWIYWFVDKRKKEITKKQQQQKKKKTKKKKPSTISHFYFTLCISYITFYSTLLNTEPIGTKYLYL